MGLSTNEYCENLADCLRNDVGCNIPCDFLPSLVLSLVERDGNTCATVTGGISHRDAYHLTKCHIYCSYSSMPPRNNKKKKKKKNNKGAAIPATLKNPEDVSPQPLGTNSSHISQLAKLRMKYTILGKAEWWWLMDDTLQEICENLRKNFFCVLDDFLGDDHNVVDRLYTEVKDRKIQGELKRGVLGGGKTGENLSYQHGQVRGDLVRWYSGQETGWKELPRYMQKIDTLINEMGASLPGLLPGQLSGINHRSDAMVTCYPSGGARYTRHCDNQCNREVNLSGVGKGSDCNGRRLTAILYLNKNYSSDLGGHLRLFEPDGETIKATIEPIANRLVLFWADRRVPHEVLPAKFERFAVTLWYFDADERKRAVADASTNKAHQAAELDALRQEIQRFEKRYGKAESISDAKSIEEEKSLPHISDSDDESEEENFDKGHLDKFVSNDSRSESPESVSKASAAISLKHKELGWTTFIRGCGGEQLLVVKIDLPEDISMKEIELMVDSSGLSISIVNVDDCRLEIDFGTLQELKGMQVDDSSTKAKLSKRTGSLRISFNIYTKGKHSKTL
eukprot:UC4_evm3s607